MIAETNNVEGSPPHGRGKGAVVHHQTAAHGITPAWAGKSLIICACASQHEDHPRVGGEKRCIPALLPDHQGSPPRGRGKAHRPCHPVGVFRITPAWAGKRRHTCGPCAAPRDHPRMGGEKAFQSPELQLPEGSPPHGRGKVGLDGGLSEAVGITPAQAGKSKLALCTPSCPTDHPRACGEKNKELEGVWLPMGSPPHGRGKEASIFDDGQRLGITPAWAGKSLFCFTAAVPIQDHPRVGGEKM